MTIQVFWRNVYGTQRLYPGCSAGEAFCAATGRKTLEPVDLTALNVLGVSYEIIPDPRDTTEAALLTAEFLNQPGLQGPTR
tara:strand:- start:632 stop:874 length:243 start_codon:yes stop_codon:yes gene_type:complete